MLLPMVEVMLLLVLDLGCLLKKPQQKFQQTITKILVGLYDFTAPSSQCLSFRAGSEMKQLDEATNGVPVTPGWLLAQLNGVTGFVPQNYIRVEEVSLIPHGEEQVLSFSNHTFFTPMINWIVMGYGMIWQPPEHTMLFYQNSTVKVTFYQVCEPLQPHSKSNQISLCYPNFQTKIPLMAYFDHASNNVYFSATVKLGPISVGDKIYLVKVNGNYLECIQIWNIN
eukprot:TRINITY_DN27537_c0_g1_i1.p1 TRINITY_DN27537_c0_g1~~TRINITY_DN27537_c0_g1_i1.p1  ORF type:complete len:225 (-),score=36.71 TRINITY_DN27537_c0_g1_i1:198-872(-)